MNLDTFLGNMQNAKPLASYGSYIKKGQHVCEVLRYYYKDTDNGKSILAADLVVRDSSGGHAIGELVGVHWRLSLAGWEAERELSRARSFVAAVFPDAAPEQHREIGAAMIQQHAARGRLVIVVGKPTFSKKAKEEAARKGTALTEADAFVVAEFMAAPAAANAPEAVAARRAKLDETHPIPQAAKPSPSFGHAMQPAPAPIQAPAGYGAPPAGYPQQVQQTQWQPAPQGYPQPPAQQVQAPPGYGALPALERPQWQPAGFGAAGPVPQGYQQAPVPQGYGAPPAPAPQGPPSFLPPGVA